MSIITVLIFLAVALMIIVATLNLGAILEVRDAEKVFNDATKAVGSEQPSSYKNISVTVENHNPLSDTFGALFGSWIGISTLTVVVATVVVLGIGSAVNKSVPEMIYSVLNFRNELKRNKYLKENTTIESAIKMQSQLEGTFSHSFDELKEVLALFKVALDESDFEELDSLSVKYMHELEFIHVIMNNSQSLEQSADYLKELDSTIKANKQVHESNDSHKALDEELSMYKQLRENMMK